MPEGVEPGTGGDDKAAQAAAAAQEDARKAAIARGDELPDPDAKADAAAQKADEDKKAAEEAARGDKKTADEQSEEIGEETADEKAEREKEEQAQQHKKRVRIPLERHEAVLNQARAREEALLQRLQALEKKDQPAPRNVLGEMKTKIDELQDKYEDHVFKGEKDEARTARKELDALRDRYTDAKVALSGDQARIQTIDSLKYEAALAKVEADYAALNPDTDTFDEAKANEVAELMSMFQAKGHTRQSSLEKAVKYVMGEAKPARKDDDGTAAALAAKRAEEARKKAAEASGKQPPNSQVTGQDNDKAGNKDGGKGFDVMKASQEQFAKLDEETKARLRGDIL